MARHRPHVTHSEPPRLPRRRTGCPDPDLPPPRRAARLQHAGWRACPRAAMIDASARARTWPSENSMSRRMPSLTAAACRSGRPSGLRTRAKPRASTPRWESALSNCPQRSTEAARRSSSRIAARCARSASAATRSRWRPMRLRWASALARRLGRQPHGCGRQPLPPAHAGRSAPRVGPAPPARRRARCSGFTRVRRICGPSRPAMREKSR